MAYEITKKLRGSTIIRVVGVDTVTVALANLAFDANETVAAASIKRVNWSTNGSITVARGATNILSLYNNGEMRLDDYGHSIANNSTSNIVITIASGGTCVLEVSKDTTYANSLIGI